MQEYKSIKKRASEKLYTALIMLEQYSFEEGLEWGKEGINPIKGNSRTKWLKKCEDIVRDYINRKWGNV